MRLALGFYQLLSMQPRGRPRRKQPYKVFTNCPCCGSHNLIKVESDVMCGSRRCEWNSFKASVDSGLFDGNIYKLVREMKKHFKMLKILEGQQQTPDGVVA